MIGYSRNRAGNVSLGSTAEANGAIAVALHRCHHCHGLHGCHGDLGRSTLQAGFKLESSPPKNAQTFPTGQAAAVTAQK